jgi:hypothetical protein
LIPSHLLDASGQTEKRLKERTPSSCRHPIIASNIETTTIQPISLRCGRNLFSRNEKNGQTEGLSAAQRASLRAVSRSLGSAAPLAYRGISCLSRLRGRRLRPEPRKTRKARKKGNWNLRFAWALGPRTSSSMEQWGLAVGDRRRYISRVARSRLRCWEKTMGCLPPGRWCLGKSVLGKVSWEKCLGTTLDRKQSDKRAPQEQTLCREFVYFSPRGMPHLARIAVASGVVFGSGIFWGCTANDLRTRPGKRRFPRRCSRHRCNGGGRRSRTQGAIAWDGSGRVRRDRNR